MDHRQLLADAAQRPVDTAGVVLAGITQDTLHTLPLGRGNSIAWLIWHAARQMDVQLAELNQRDQLWTAGGWATRLEVDGGPGSFGFGDSLEAVAAFHIQDPGQLHGYLAAVVDAFTAHVRGLTEDELDAIVDEAWDPPVSLGVRLVSIIDDAVAHLGQAAYARGLLEDWRIGY